MSGFFDDAPPEPPRRVPPAGNPARSRALIGTAVVLVAAFFLVSIFTGLWTDRLWYASVGYSSVFNKILITRVALFLVFGLLMGLAVGANIVVAYRFRPLFRPASPEQVNLDRYREVIDPVRRWLVIGIAALLAVFAGGAAGGQWREFLLWQNAQPFGKTDPYFGKDIGFFVFDLPWYHYIVDFLMAIVILSLIAAAVVHYLFGGIRLQVKHDKFSGAAQAQVSVLAGIFVLLKAVDYWLDRFDLSNGGGSLFTGIGYTDQHAVIPSKNILTFIALICALLFFANVLRRTWLLPSVGLALLVLSSILLGAVWPGIVQQFQVKPSEPDTEGPFISRNIAATRAAFDISGTQVTPYKPSLRLSSAKLRSDTQSIPGIRLLDPALVSSAFEQLQQVRGYYSVKPILDVDRYKVNNVTRDLVVSVRELNQSGLPAAQRNWANLHTVYTHGYGMVAAFGNQRNVDGQEQVNDGKPIWAEKNLPPNGYLTQEFGYQPRIYFGEESPNYSIVGKPSSGPNVELDLPQGQGANATTNTYAGGAGVPVGGLLNKLLYAIKFSEPNIVLSSRVNSNSRILYDRTPQQRVQQVAPWLTLDRDVYPAVVNKRIVWIVDGYTTTDRYPNSQKDSLATMVSDAQNPRTSYAALPTDQINYMRNSVKAVVDAYTGKVTLYNWDKDPIVNAWSQAFPGVLEPRSDIPQALLAHMRYPEDLFKVQRNMLATYHVLNSKTFYDGSDKWIVPVDPQNKALNQPPYRLSVKTPGGGPDPVFSLTSVFVPNNRQNLASFISVDADARRKDYGKIRILRLPSNTQVPGPSQIANLFGADSNIQGKLLAFTRTNSKAIFGNLLTLPVGDGLLYVQPLYTLRKTGEGRYPVLRYVLVSFGESVGIGTTLTGALDDVLGISGGSSSGGSGSTSSGGGGGAGGAVPSNVRDLLNQAEQEFVKAQAALRRSDLTAYAKSQARARALVQQALQAADRASATPSGKASASPSGTASASPSGTASASPSGTASASPSGTASASPSGKASASPSAGSSGGG